MQCKRVISDGQRFYPTSPLRDYAGSPGRRRRSQSASVRFKDARVAEEDVSNTQADYHLLCSVRKFSQEGTLSQQQDYIC